MCAQTNNVIYHPVIYSFHNFLIDTAVRGQTEHIIHSSKFVTFVRDSIYFRHAALFDVHMLLDIRVCHHPDDFDLIRHLPQDTSNFLISV